MNKRKLKYGMVGGGHGAFIGAVHRMAANLDGQLELVCGAFSSKPEKSKASGADLFLPEERCYGTFEEMMLSEAALPSDVRMDFVVIVTPNHLHFPAAKSAMENGFHVVSDKPATLTADEARTLRSLSKKTGLLYALTHNYTGYPMVRQARVMVRDGMLGKIRKVVVEYPQGWLSQDDGGVWRTDPAIAGAGGCLGDIGSHAENLAAYITGLDLDEIAADLTAFVEGRRLDDDVNVLLRYKGGAKGILQSSQIAVGEENDIRIFVYGETGGLEWRQFESNTLLFKPDGAPVQRYRTGVGELSPEAVAATRVPAGHPEGYIEAFANIYVGFTDHLRSILDSHYERNAVLDYPGVDEAVAGMAFIEAAVESSKKNAAWTKVNA